jgi:hypothetical protein
MISVNESKIAQNECFERFLFIGISHVKLSACKLIETKSRPVFILYKPF